MLRPERDSGPRKNLGPTVKNLGWLAKPDPTASPILKAIRDRIFAGRTLLGYARAGRIDGDLAILGCEKLLETSEFLLAHGLAASFAAWDLVGPDEIAKRCDVRSNTVSMWAARGLLPPPEAIISRVPLWRWPVIERWAQSTGRLVSESPEKVAS